MITRFRKSRLTKILAVYLSLNFFLDIFHPAKIFALTGGPSQPESQSFSPANVSEVVDLSTGDFSYNIPLLDIDGYPINLIYNAGIKMEQEASWVGLGWNINPGAITRDMRGLPDDYNGDVVEKKMKIKDNKTYGLTGAAGCEVFGVGGGASGGVGVTWNNYTGASFSQFLNLEVQGTSAAKNVLTFKLGINSSSDKGLDIKPKLEFNPEGDESNKYGIGTGYNSREGMKSLSYQTGVITTNSGGALNASFAPGNTISFGTPTYTPSISNSFKTKTITCNIKAGTALFGTYTNGEVGGFYSAQKLINNYQYPKAFGYMYLENSLPTQNNMMDFNREKDGPFTANSTNLALTNLTYDIFTVTGQGISGTFRPFRSDVGTVFDSPEFIESESGTFGGEAGFGELAHQGVDVNVVSYNANNGPWITGNWMANILKFQKNEDDLLFEPFYFKQVGELSVESDVDFKNTFGSDQPMMIDLNKVSDFNVNTGLSYTELASTPKPLQINSRTERCKRTQLMSFLNIKEASKFGFNPSYVSELENAKPYHIGEITVTKPDGNRYIYGMPCYINSQEEATFNVNGRVENEIEGIVQYLHVDNSIENSNSVDEYYNSTTLPPYSYSFLLTNIISDDYIDVDNNGPSENDFGNYTVFKYTDPLNYKWRIPYELKQANLDQGIKAIKEDDKGSYIYGEKDIRYLQTIESRNYIAVFETSDRKDGYGVSGPNGGFSLNSKLQKLNGIKLYSKKDYNPQNPESSTPIKEIYFEYDYSLCSGVPNSYESYVSDEHESGNQYGKLTLKRIYIYYGKSKKGRLSPYEFEYNGLNPDYSYRGNDRWGSFKPNVPQKPNFEFPYVSQDIIPITDPNYDSNDPDRTYADLYAESWNLTGIKFPSGGKYTVSYEADDYTHVQNRKAMQMFDVKKIDINQIVSNFVEQNDGILMSSFNPNDYIYFKLQTPIISSNINEAEDEFYEKYFSGIKNLYFKFYVNLTKSSGWLPNVGNKYAYVSGYCEYDDYGLAQTNAGTNVFDYGFVKLKSVPIGDSNNGLTEVNPIAKAAWQYSRLNTPRLIWDQPGIDETASVKSILTIIASSNIYLNLLQTIWGQNRTLLTKGYGIEVNNQKSFIRLNSPSGFKKGGGHRVKKVEYADNWGEMTNQVENNFSYGKLYNYTDSENDMIVSSGVATYEPFIGGDENPWRQPRAFDVQNFLAPDNSFYLEEPFGESFFPSPVVNYKKVTVTDIKYEAVKKHATGKTVYEYYTSFDFPTILSEMLLMPINDKTKPYNLLGSLDSKDFVTASQGYCIELNDMSGKPKAQWVYAEGQKTPISGVEYKYSTKNGHLNNRVKVIDKYGTVSMKDIGVEYDVIADTRNSYNSTISSNAKSNGDEMIVFGAFVVIPVIIAVPGKEQTQFQSIVLTKVVRKYGLLSEVVYHDLGSKVSQQNVCYDAETGQVLLTKTNNEYKDPLYSFRFPAYWAFDGMGPAYKNVGVETNLIFINGTADIESPGNYFSLGDEVSINASVMGWVSEVNANSIKILKYNGASLSGLNHIRVLRSGRKNQTSLDMATIVSLSNPLTNIKNNIYEKVIEAKSIEYSDEWKTYCDCVDLSDVPYKTGKKGIWRPLKSYTYITERTQENQNNNTNTRRDGVYKSFSPFWKFGTVAWYKDATNWTWMAEVTKKSPYGYELENVDPLYRYSSAYYGNNNTLPVAVSNNSKYKESGFDGFEDYYENDCNDHFSFKGFPGQIYNYLNNSNSHTGSYCLKIGQGDNVYVTKQIVDCD